MPSQTTLKRSRLKQIKKKQDDEVIEVTPKGVRLRKRELDAEKRKANSKRKKIPDLLV